MGTIRQRSNGTYELRVTHRALEKPYYTTHDTREQAQRYDADLKRALDAGQVPKELQKPKRGKTLLSVLETYQGWSGLAKSDVEVVSLLIRQCEDLVVGQVTLKWAYAWVSKMKRQDNLAPGTIRKRVESLARCIDWHNKREHEADNLPANPLRLLGSGYSTYGPEDGPARVDVDRDRRLLPGEAERIEAVILGAKAADRQRPIHIEDRDKFLLLWRLASHLGLRLRENYTLQVQHIRLPLRTIHVARSKTGRARDVPLPGAIYDCLIPHVEGRQPEEFLFPFWLGTEADLKKCTARLSAQFARVFEHAGCEGLTEHDLRHEAICRWMEMKNSQGHWLFRPEEIRRITGHKSVQMFERYLSLRGSDLAERLS